MKNLLSLFLAAVSFLAITSCKTKFETNQANLSENTISNISIEVQSVNDQFVLKCNEGCAWKTLTFSNKLNKPQGVDEYGMTKINKENIDNEKSNLADFKFEIENLGNEVKFKGLKGFAWTNLKYNCLSEIDCYQKINQFGMIN